MRYGEVVHMVYNKQDDKVFILCSKWKPHSGKWSEAWERVDCKRCIKKKKEISSVPKGTIEVEKYTSAEMLGRIVNSPKEYDRLTVALAKELLTCQAELNQVKHDFNTLASNPAINFIVAGLSLFDVVTEGTFPKLSRETNAALELVKLKAKQ